MCTNNQKRNIKNPKTFGKQNFQNYSQIILYTTIHIYEDTALMKSYLHCENEIPFPFLEPTVSFIFLRIFYSVCVTWW